MIEDQREDIVKIEYPNQLIALALEKQADPNIISKLMDLQERWQAGQARKAYVSAMTAFKQEAPAVLKKGDQVDFTTAKGRTRYNYANLGSIVQEITAILGKHELSASWSTNQDGINVTVTCHITHIAGHRESVTLTGPIDESGNKNRIQAVGSTVTYLQRYTLLAALGLATGEDDDGRGGVKSQPEIKEPQKKANGEAKKDSGSPMVHTIITDVKEYAAKKSGGNPSYRIIGVLGGNEQSFWTFDTKIKDLAETEKNTNVPLVLEYTKSTVGDKTYLNITSLTRQEREPGAEG